MVARELCGRIFEDYRDQTQIEDSARPSLTYSDKSTLRLKQDNVLNASIERSGQAPPIGFKTPLLDEPDNVEGSSSRYVFTIPQLYCNV